MFKITIILGIIALVSSCSCDIPFDSNKWKTAPAKGPEMSIRWDMSNDLLETHNLIGKDTTELFKLLGRANYNCYTNTKECYVSYALGPCHRGIDIGTLDLTFQHGKVVEIVKHCN